MRKPAPSKTSKNLKAALDALQSLLGEKFSSGMAVRDHHSHDESWHSAKRPDAVCFAESTEDVAGALAICHRYRIPVVPFGTGTGLEGGTVAHQGGLCIDTSRMQAIIEVNADDMDCRVQAGVTRKQLDRYLHDSGLFFPIDPGADASLGGMAATRASGTNAVRYGTMRENVLSLKAVMADGSIVTTGRRSRKSAAGYDLTRLFVGSEGTLGIITELTLRLHGRPEAISSGRVYFDDVDEAVNTAIQTIQCGIPIARVELLDAAQMEAINRYSGTCYPGKDALFLEFHGSPASVKEQAETVGTICAALGGSDFEWTAFEEERRAMWDARHSAAYAAMAVRPAAKVYATDVCVPISRLADCIRETRADVHKSTGISSFLLGHIGDGNFHYVFLVDPDDPAEYKTVLDLSERMVQRAIDMGGTCTGEHGIGIGKQKFLNLEFGEAAVALMRTIKAAVDPHDIMNPGKLLPPQ
ncbi:MAG TPA: FAD-linked oxidase C-terminal domain-containing protein [Woeseiaceae bacterium]|nr:FAD-linked oxidase C-terminal domain-containing protein [Woeseiaceae bacterium]